MNTQKYDLLIIFLVTFALGFLSFEFGRSYGWKERDKFQEELDCTVPYSHKPIAEVPVECLKYFKIKPE